MEENVKKYIVRITETLAKDVEVEAKDKLEAKDIVLKQYANSDIVLDSADYTDYEIDVVKEV